MLRGGKILNWVTNSFILLTSGGTLICCALPALFISLGAGAALAGLVSAVPQLIWVSKHKFLVFGVAGAGLLINGLLQLRPQSCPADRLLAITCAQTKKTSKAVYLASLIVYGLGVFFAFVLPYLKH